MARTRNPYTGINQRRFALMKIMNRTRPNITRNSRRPTSSRPRHTNLRHRRDTRNRNTRNQTSSLPFILRAINRLRGRRQPRQMNRNSSRNMRRAIHRTSTLAKRGHQRPITRARGASNLGRIRGGRRRHPASVQQLPSIDRSPHTLRIGHHRFQLVRHFTLVLRTAHFSIVRGPTHLVRTPVLYRPTQQLQRTQT